MPFCLGHNTSSAVSHPNVSLQWVRVHDRAIRRRFSPGSGKLDFVCTGPKASSFAGCINSVRILTINLTIRFHSIKYNENCFNKYHNGNSMLFEIICDENQGHGICHDLL